MLEINGKYTTNITKLPQSALNELSYLHQQAAIFQTGEIQGKKYYKNPFLARGFICLAPYLQQKIGNNRGRQFLEIQSENERNLWLVTHYVEYLQDLKKTNTLSKEQSFVYESEINEFEEVRRQIQLGNTIVLPSFSIEFLPELIRDKIINNEPGLEHELINVGKVTTSDLFDKQIGMLSTVLLDDSIRTFLDKYKQIFTSLQEILQALGDVPNEIQMSICENLIHVDLNQHKDQLIRTIKSCSELNDYYDFVVMINKLHFDSLKTWAPAMYADRLTHQDGYLGLLRTMHTKGSFGLDKISLPNPTLRPKGFNAFLDYMGENNLSLSQFLKLYK